MISSSHQLPGPPRRGAGSCGAIPAGSGKSKANKKEKWNELCSLKDEDPCKKLMKKIEGASATNIIEPETVKRVIDARSRLSHLKWERTTQQRTAGEAKKSSKTRANSNSGLELPPLPAAGNFQHNDGGGDVRC